MQRTQCLYWLLGLTALFSGSVVAQEPVLNAREYFLTGAAKYKCNACEYAVKDFSSAIELQKDYAEAWYGRSLSYACLGQYKDALTDIKMAIRYNKEEPLYLEASGRFKSAIDDSLGAVRDFRSAIALDSNIWQAWYGLGLEQFRMDEYNDALASFDESLRINKTFTMGYIDRARLYLKITNYPFALTSLVQAEELEPEYAPIKELMARTYMEMGVYDMAIKTANKAIKLDRELWQAWYVRGESYFRIEQYKKADADFEVALELNKTIAEAWYKRGICNTIRKDFKSARKYYTKAIRYDPVRTDYYVSRAELWVKLEKPKKAISDLAKAISLNDQDLDLYRARALLFIELENYQEAMADLDKVVFVRTDDAEAFFYLGNAKYQSGNTGAACADWSRALELGLNKAKGQLVKYCQQ